MPKSLRSDEAIATATILKRLRDDEGLTLRELAERLEVAHSKLSNIETHQQQVDVPEFIQWVEALGRDPIELLQQVMDERNKLRRT